MKKIYHSLCASLLCSMFILSVLLPVSAAEPTVATDESVYVNLDYYGVETGTTVVKGCNLNGNTEFTDLGAYDKVTNMTGYDKPELGSDGVHWKLSSPSGRFYYECTPKQGTVTLPWTFDVSYKLNGVPKRAEELLEANGLIEINIECIPNENAAEYYRNNMILQAATVIDLQDTLSIDAPGAQIQSMGTYKAVVFAALPGEHTTFTLRIGTESFEFPGVTMMMIPGTLEQLKDIKEIKEAKDTVKDSADAIYDGMSQILSLLNGMNGGLSSTKSGLASLNSARSMISSSKNAVYDNADAALDDLSALSNELTALLPHFETANQLVNSLNSNANQLNADITELKSVSDDIGKSTKALEKDMNAFRRALSDVNATKEQRKDVHESLVNDIENLQSDFELLGKRLPQLSRGLLRVSDSTDDLSKLLEQLSKSQMGAALAGNLLKALAALGGGDENFNALVGQIQTQAKAINSALNALSSKTTEITDDVSYLSKATASSVGALSNLSNTGKEMCDTLNEALELANTYFEIADSTYASADDALAQAEKVSAALTKASAVTGKVIDDANAFNKTINNHHEGTKALINNLSGTTSALAKGTTSTRSFLSSFQNLLRESGKELDRGTQSTLDGLISVLQNALDSMGVNNTLQRTNDTIKDTTDRELDKFEDENKFLNLDADLKPVSFTSTENPTPASLQVILRTQEITKDALDDDSDLETTENSSFWSRLANVFISIGEGIVSIFVHD